MKIGIEVTREKIFMMVIKLGKKKTFCDLCGMKFSSFEELKLHTIHKHNNIKSVLHDTTDSNIQTKPSMKNSFLCDVCDLKFSDFDELNTHIKNNHTNQEAGFEDNGNFPSASICLATAINNAQC